MGAGHSHDAHDHHHGDAGIRAFAWVTLLNLGYKDVAVNTVFHQYMAAFPETQKRSRELIYNSAISF